MLCREKSKNPQNNSTSSNSMIPHSPADFHVNLNGDVKSFYQSLDKVNGETIVNGDDDSLLKVAPARINNHNAAVIPSGAKLLDHQVAGHFYHNGKLGFLSDSQPGLILKPIQSFPRGMIECAFYSRVFSSDFDQDGILVGLRDLIPRFHGIVHVKENDITYMRLQDVASLTDSPVAIMDVKMGRHTWDPKSSEEKRKRADGKYPYAAQIGFQITGFRTFMKDEETGEEEMKHFYSDYTRKLVPDDLLDKAFRVYFGGRNLRKGCIERTLSQLRNIREWFNSQRLFCFYSSSLLIVHSAKADEDDYADRIANVRLIDFAHVYPASGEEPDENFLHGLRTLIAYLEKLLDGTC